MQVRLCTINVKLFQHDGLRVGSSWGPLELDGIAPETRAALITFTGRLIRVHPDDVAALRSIGLDLVGGKVVEAAKAKPATPPAARSPPAKSTEPSTTPTDKR
jgi:hypothetical protein